MTKALRKGEWGRDNAKEAYIVTPIWWKVQMAAQMKGAEQRQLSKKESFAFFL